MLRHVREGERAREARVRCVPTASAEHSVAHQHERDAAASCLAVCLAVS